MPAPEISTHQDLRIPGFPDWFAGLLIRRGASTAQDVEQFLHPSLDQLHSPYLLHGLPKAVERLLLARNNGERIAIVGDYDVDGICGTAIISAVLRACGLEVETILPHRQIEGYGFQLPHVHEAIKRGCNLILTVDCGTSSAVAATEALREGLSVLITDHHLPSEKLPEDVIFINPHQIECEYPFLDLSGAGLALKLAMAFSQACAKNIDARRLLRIACLGTIADLVPLLGENRTIAKLGLKALDNTSSTGLKALMEISKVRSPIMADDVGYRLGPRLNAPGRMSSADSSLELLLSRDPADSRRLALELDAANRERQSWEKKVTADATQMFRGETSPILIGQSKGWHRGVIGIAAGRLAKEWNRPVILFSIDGGKAIGSGRSIPGIHLYNFLSQWKSQIPHFGGHDQAVGLTVPEVDLNHWREIWNNAANEWLPRIRLRQIIYEVSLQLDRINSETFLLLSRLEPFGQKNPRPLIRIQDTVRLKGRPRIFGDGHVSGEIENLTSAASVKFIAWNWAKRLSQMATTFEVIGTIDRDHFSGEVVWQIIDVKTREFRCDNES